MPVWWSRKRTPSGSRSSRRPLRCRPRCRLGHAEEEVAGARPQARPVEGARARRWSASGSRRCRRISRSRRSGSSRAAAAAGRVEGERVEVVEEVDPRLLREAAGARHGVVLELRQGLAAEARSAGPEERPRRVASVPQPLSAASRMAGRSSVALRHSQKRQAARLGVLAQAAERGLDRRARRVERGRGSPPAPSSRRARVRSTAPGPWRLRLGGQSEPDDRAACGFGKGPADRGNRSRRA